MEYNTENIKDLLFEKVVGTISEQDDLIVEQAILHDAAVRKMWEELSRKMETSEGKKVLSQLDPEQAWEETAGQLSEKPGSGNRRYSWPLIGVAATLILAIPFAWYLSSGSKFLPADQKVSAKQVYLKTEGGGAVDLSKNQSINVGQTNIHTKQDVLTYTSGSADNKEWATLVVPAAKDYKIKLSDGTMVWLNAASSLRFPFTFNTKKREVYLTGEAYFEVAKNQSQEFVVHTSYAAIHVHGTSFNVNAYDARNFTAALIEGSVSAKLNDQMIKIKPGEGAVLGKERLQIIKPDLQEVLAWRDGIYTFHNKPLSEISQVLSRWFDVEISWHTPEVAVQTFTGEIDKSLPLDVLIGNLKLASGIQAELKNGKLTFK